MLTDGHIGYGLGLTALFEVLLTVAVPRWRRPALIATTTVVAVLAVLGWQYILRATHAAHFFTDLPFRPFPIRLEDGRRRTIDSLVFANIAEMAKYARLSEAGRPVGSATARRR